MNKKEKPSKKNEKNLPADGTNWEEIAKRALADLDNYKKQQEKMRGEMTQFMSITLMHKFLSVYDDLDRVINMEDISDSVKEGVQAIEKKFDDIFVSEGLEKISAIPGDKFDPNTMEAISYEEHEEYKEDTVIDQFEVGLKYKDKVIKPIKVRVSKGVKNG